MTPATDVLDDPVMFTPEVVRVVRKSATTIWRDEKRDKFPRRHYEGKRAAWFKSQIAV
jgi:predicted DNA-binding transcriptional regulator AlpA